MIIMYDDDGDAEQDWQCIRQRFISRSRGVVSNMGKPQRFKSTDMTTSRYLGRSNWRIEVRGSRALMTGRRRSGPTSTLCLYVHKSIIPSQAQARNWKIEKHCRKAE